MINFAEHRRTVVHCPTEELIKKVEDQIVEMGGRRLWDKGADAFLLKEKEPNGMCFGLEDIHRGLNCYCNLSYYKKSGYNVITAAQFLTMCGKPTEEPINNDYAIY